MSGPWSILSLLVAGQIFSSSQLNKFWTFLAKLIPVRRKSFTLKLKIPPVKAFKMLLIGPINGPAIESTILTKLLVKAPTISCAAHAVPLRTFFAAAVIMSAKASFAPFITFVAAQNRPSNMVLTKGIIGASTAII